MDLTIWDLVKRFDSGEIRLPLMQRDYVWNPKKVVRLLDSLYRGWPIGSFYVWRTNDEYPQKERYGKVVPRALDGFAGFLLDGQQRLTSLSNAIKAEAEVELEHRAFFDLENEVFYLGEMKLTLKKRIDAADPLLVPLSEIVGADGDGALEGIERVLHSCGERAKLGKANHLASKYRQRLHRVATMMKRVALCEVFDDNHEEHAFELFSRLNKGGTSLSAGDVEAARLASAATKGIVQPMRAVAAEPEMHALGINFVFLLRALVTVNRGNCSFSKLPKSWAESTYEVEKSWRETERGLRTAVSFVRDEVGWTTRRWLPSTMALIPIVYLFAKTSCAKLGAKESRLLRQYLAVSGLRSFFRGATETAVNTYVNAVGKSLEDRGRAIGGLLARIPKNRLFRITKEDVRGTIRMYSPLMQVYLLYLQDRQARSWPSGRTLRDVLHEKEVGDPLAVHHIFPKKLMQDRDVPIERLNTVANYAILSQADNAELGDRSPQDVWRSLKPSQQEWASEQLCFSASESLLKLEAYDEFISYRAEKLAERLNDFLHLGRH